MSFHLRSIYFFWLRTAHSVKWFLLLLFPQSLKLRSILRLFHFVFTFRYSKQFKTQRTKREHREMEGERRVGIAVDFSACSKIALRWAVDNVVRDGDHVILVTVLPEGPYEHGEMQLWAVTGSPLIPLVDFSDPTIMKKYGAKPDPETLDIVNTAARQKQIVVLLKIYWGDAREKICEAIDKIPLSCLVIGNRGLGKIKRAILGSVSNYVVNNGSCPVTVVKQGGHES